MTHDNAYDEFECQLLAAAKAEKPDLQVKRKTLALALALGASVDVGTQSALLGKTALGKAAGLQGWAGAKLALALSVGGAGAVAGVVLAVSSFYVKPPPHPVQETASFAVPPLVAPPVMQELPEADAGKNPELLQRGPSNGKPLTKPAVSAAPRKNFAPAERSPNPALSHSAAPPAVAEPPQAPDGSSPSGLGEELKLLNTARSALAEHDAARALQALTEHAQRFPHGDFKTEREVLWIDALALAGELNAARARAREFLVYHAGSVQAARVRRALLNMARAETEK